MQPHDDQQGGQTGERGPLPRQPGALRLQTRIAGAHDHTDQDQAGQGDQHQNRRHKGNRRGGRQRLAEPDRPLLPHPAAEPAGRTHQSGSDQGNGREPDGQLPSRRETGEGRDGHPGGQKAQRGTDPGQERALVGEGEAGVGFAADPVHLTGPAAWAGERSGSVIASMLERRTGGAAESWPSTTETSTITAPTICHRSAPGTARPSPSTAATTGLSRPRKVTELAGSCCRPQNHNAYARMPLTTTR